MDRLRVAIVEDGMAARATMSPGPAVPHDELLQALGAHGVVHGISPQAVACLGEGACERPVLVAEGTQPTRGDAEQLHPEHWHHATPGQRAAGGSIDYHERHLLHPVREGDVVGAIQPCTLGDPGRDVRGKHLPGLPGERLPLDLGEGVHREGRTLVARTAGVALFTGQRIDVVPLYTHPRDVDYASGNLHMQGSLLVEGEVAAGFLVEASGDIAVHGSVHGAVRAGGSAYVEHGIMGRQGVRAQGDLTCHHATDGRLRSGNQLTIGDHTSHCVAYARTIAAHEGRATVRGGQMYARDRIVVGCAGAGAGTPTLLAVGHLLDTRAELARRNADVHRESRRDKRSTSADDPRKGKRHASKALDRASHETLRLRRLQRELIEAASIRVTGTCHCGVTVEFGPYRLEVERDLHDTTFRFDPKTNSIRFTEKAAP